MSQSVVSRRAGAGLLPAMSLFLVFYLVARFLLRDSTLPEWLRIGAALLPVPAFVVLLFAHHRAIGRLDELQRFIQLQALAFAFPATWVMMLTLGLLELVVDLPPQDLGYRHVWAIMPILYWVGLWLARRKFDPGDGQ